ncbi:hypothetical protein D3C75_700080 [compost metagenome]
MNHGILNFGIMLVLTEGMGGHDGLVPCHQIRSGNHEDNLVGACAEDDLIRSHSPEGGYRLRQVNSPSVRIQGHVLHFADEGILHRRRRAKGIFIGGKLGHFRQTQLPLYFFYRFARLVNRQMDNIRLWLHIQHPVFL